MMKKGEENGIMEYWNAGMLGTAGDLPILPLFQYSNIPMKGRNH
jgi:hypothetical protein